VASVSGATETFVRRRAGADGPEDVTVDDAAWATLRTTDGAVVSLEVSRMALGRKNSLQIEVYGSAGSLAFDLEALNELQVCTDPAVGFARMLVTEPDQPYVGAWWPPGHILGWDHTFTNQAADFLAAIASGSEPSPSFADGLAVQRVLAAVEESAARSGQRVELDRTVASVAHDREVGDGVLEDDRAGRPAAGADERLADG
jgi:predicted dehydrogenase